ncbi:50S ribosomal protein L21 [Sphingomonas sp.]|uniref:50S ribosomal protein L21 n=1 Tax=Sphingomonas sp. TaxID=28214 RepID=UPI00286D0314|nr:50S ribosomal protein L21 [Sphingomonas sp.]
MFAIVRTGGKQYRVAPGDKIVVEKLAGEAGDTFDITDVLLAGEGGDLKSTVGLTVAAKIIAQAKADKVTVFKKRRRHNYRRKAGHRQQHTIIEIVSIGGKKAEKKTEPKGEAKTAPAKTEAPAKVEAKVEKPAAKAAKPVAEKAPAAKKAPAASTKDAAPAKAAAKKAAPKAAAKPKK